MAHGGQCEWTRTRSATREKGKARTPLPVDARIVGPEVPDKLDELPLCLLRALQAALFLHNQTRACTHSISGTRAASWQGVRRAGRAAARARNRQSAVYLGLVSSNAGEDNGNSGTGRTATCRRGDGRRLHGVALGCCRRCCHGGACTFADTSFSVLVVR